MKGFVYICRKHHNTMTRNTSHPLVAAILLGCLLTLTTGQPVKGQSLESGFRNPPIKYRPFAWWHWMGPNITREGITKDLESMKTEGLGGATIFNLTSEVMGSNAPIDSCPWPENRYRSNRYWELLAWACHEARRLGLELGLHNAPGYSTTGGPWIDEGRGMKHLVSSFTEVEGNGEKQTVRLSMPTLTQFLGTGENPNPPTLYSDVAVVAVGLYGNAAGKRVVLGNCEANGTITWKVPKGLWRIYRIGLCPTMAVTHPTPDDVGPHSLEVDKINAAKNRWHWDQVLQPLRHHIGDYFGTTFRHIFIDSYEAGLQDWGEHVTKTFKELRGYAPTPYLPLLLSGGKDTTGYTADTAARFMHDYWEVMPQLFNEATWKVARQKVNAEGLLLEAEPYWGLFYADAGAQIPDVPYGEFWTHSDGRIEYNVAAGARAGGHSVVGAESFSAQPQNAHWTEDPNYLKPSAEGAMVSGVNRFSLHQWVLQPFSDSFQPGNTMGWWGTHFSRFQPWFPLGKAFFHYLGRCQYLLQQGQQVIDRLIVSNDHISENYVDAIAMTDFTSQDIRVSQGMTVLPSGRRYPLLQIATEGSMEPGVLLKIGKLLDQGATVVVAKRPTRSPSLSGYPVCDGLVSHIADSIWSRWQGRRLFANSDEAMQALKMEPDFKFLKGEGDVVHRHTDDADIFYVANLSDSAQECKVSLRTEGRKPELWTAENGLISNVKRWYFEKGRTVVELDLAPWQSRFVVFRHKASATDIATGKNKSPRPSFPHYTVTLDKPWQVEFRPKLHYPFSIKGMRLCDFSQNKDERIKYFAGTAIYRTNFQLTKKILQKADRVTLSLGEMSDIASVKVNSSPADTLWYAPYNMDITGQLHTGKNTITIEVAVNWTNMLIGEERYPDDLEYGKSEDLTEWWHTTLKEVGRPLKALPHWLTDGTRRPQSKRSAFTTWNYFTKESPLVKAGLEGPVRINFFQAEEEP